MLSHQGVVITEQTIHRKSGSLLSSENNTGRKGKEQKHLELRSSIVAVQKDGERNKPYRCNLVTR
jgi:hypothetical protein